MKTQLHIKSPFSFLLKISAILLFMVLGVNPAYSSHMVGSDITYKCTSPNGDYKVTLVYYRDCAGIPTCGNGQPYPSGQCVFINTCTKQVKVRGADPSCNGVLFLTFTVTGVSVRDVNPNPRCANGKTICDNMGCIAPGSLTPGIERYEFEGTVNIGPNSGIPASCCNVVFSFDECCRNGAIQNISPQNFYTEATVNRCAATYPDCNSPDLTNDPYAILCAGQGFVFNNGAFDPDMDSLVYSFAPSLYDYGVTATYIPPYSYDIPMPYKAPLTGNYPYGFHIDPLSGDIMFTPNAFPFTGCLALRIEQWRLINGVYVVVGVTRRDLQMYIKYCDPNTPPTLRTEPPGSPPLKPKTNYEVCAGSLICFDVIAKDTDFNPPTISDTTYLSWTGIMAQFGATFLPNYNPATRKILGPREDTYKLCWTPQDIHCKRGAPTTYRFTIKGEDSRCPYPGTVIQSFAIKVLPRAKVTTRPIDYHCGNFAMTYDKDPTIIPAQTFQSSTWSIAKDTGDFNFNGGAKIYTNVQTTPVIYFPKGGRYFVELVINMLGPTGGAFCSMVLHDTLYVDFPVNAVVRDTFTCQNIPMVISASGKFGSPSYTYRWFNNIKDTLTPLNGPFFGNANLNIAPTSTRNYTIQVRDLNGCRSWDSMTVKVKNLPIGTLPDSSRICYGDTFLLDPGNNSGNIRSFLWNTSDTTQTVVRRDSNTFIVQLTDTFGCQNTDTMRLFVNAKINARAGLDTSICSKDSISLMGTGGRMYLWKNLSNGLTISGKSYVPMVKVSPASQTKYQLTVYQSYPDTTNKVLECNAVDTVVISVYPLPTLGIPSTPSLACYGSSTVNLYPFNSTIPGQQGGTGVWTYPKAPGAVLYPNTGPGITTQPQIKLDSLKNKPPGDNYNTYINYVNYTYTEPVHGCKNTDSAKVYVYGRPPVDAGIWLSACENSGTTFDLLSTGTTGYQTIHNVQPKYSGPAFAQFYWYGNGIDSVITANSKKFTFNPSKTGVLKSPSYNLITYKYYQPYQLLNYNSLNYTTNCVNTDTTRFYVTPVPQIDAGSPITICKNEPQFNLATKSGASVIPGTGQSFWIAPKHPTTVGKGIVNGGIDFDASVSGVPYSVTNELIVYKDTSTGCVVQDSTYLTIVGYPKVDVSFSLSNKNLDADTVCRLTGSYNLYTWINDTLRKGYTDPASPEYSYLAKYAGNPANTAWHPKDFPGADSANAYFNTEQSDLSSGMYQLTFRYSQSNGTLTCSNTDVATIKVEEPPTVVVSPGQPICDYTVDVPVSVDIQPTTYTASWACNPNLGSFGNPSQNSTTFIPSAAAKAAAGAWVYAASTQLGTCLSRMDSTFIRIDKKPVADFNCPDCDGCEPLTSNLSVKSSGVPQPQYQWTWADGYNTNTSDSAFTRTIPSYGSGGEHPFTLTVTSGESTGCIAKKEGKMVVRAKPQAAFTFTPPYTTVAKPFYTFTNSSWVKDNSALTYLWDMGNLPQADPLSRIYTEANPKNVEFKQDTTLVRMRVTTEYQCWDTTSHLMKVEPDITVFAPNAFYPNSGVPCPDGNSECNRVFQIAATGYASVEIFVFNRWGQQVYYSTKAEEGWNGKIHNTGAECPQDVYIYQVNATSFNGKLYKYSGSITLLR